MKKRIFATLLALVMALGLTLPASAEGLDGGSTGEPVVTIDTPADTTTPTTGDSTATTSTTPDTPASTSVGTPADTPVATALATPSSGDISYMAWDDTDKKLTHETIAESECSPLPTPIPDNDYVVWNTGWYVVKENTTINCQMSVKGDVKLILCDGATLTVEALEIGGPNGIRIDTGASLTIYG